jgi:GT2 family glycosyltransferase
LNTDTLPGPGSLKRLVDFAEAHPRAAMVGALLLNADGTFQASYADFPSLRGETLLLLGLARRLLRPEFPNYGPDESETARTCDWVQGACLLVRQDALSDIGLLDEGYFMYTEETDWCARCWKAGWEVWFTPDAQIVHYGGQSAAREPAAKRRQLYRSKARFFRKHRGALAGAIFSAIVQITSGLKLIFWALMSALRRGERRASARTNVQAYLTVLGFAR